MASNTLQLVLAASVLLMGSLLMLDNDFTVAYGTVSDSWGGGLIFASVLFCVSSLMGFFGARSHNKCCLACVLALSSVGLLTQFLIGAIMGGAITPAFSDDTVLGCVEKGSASLYPSDACTALFEDESTMRLFRLWMVTYNESLKDERRKLELVNVEENNYCCGFGPPNLCTGRPVANTSPDGTDLLTSSAPLTQALGRCSTRRGWYTSSHYCDVEASGERGCPYMFPVTATCIRDENLRKGCAFYFQDRMLSRTRPISVSILVFLIFQVPILVMSLCLCLKRKDGDVLPAPKAFVLPAFERFALADEDDDGDEEDR